MPVYRRDAASALEREILEPGDRSVDPVEGTPQLRREVGRGDVEPMGGEELLPTVPAESLAHAGDVVDERHAELLRHPLRWGVRVCG